MTFQTKAGSAVTIPKDRIDFARRLKSGAIQIVAASHVGTAKTRSVWTAGDPSDWNRIMRCLD